jgi:heptosyltransferase-3
LKRLIIRPGAMGDFIVSLPAIDCLRTEYLEVWCAAQNVPLAAHFASQAHAISSTGLDLLELGAPDPRLLNRLRGFDSIISWYGANRPEFRSVVAELGLPFQFFAALPPEGCGKHAVDFYVDQVLPIAGHSSTRRPVIELGITRRDFAVIHPFAGSSKKRWPLDRFQALAARLASHMPVEWCAGPEDEMPGARRFADLMELARWLASARIYIGNDSGPTHLAAAVQTDVVALFGPTDPAVWAPRGGRVTVITAPPGAPSMDAISVEQVMEAVRDMLALRVL